MRLFFSLSIVVLVPQASLGCELFKIHDQGWNDLFDEYEVTLQVVDIADCGESFDYDYQVRIAFDGVLAGTESGSIYRASHTVYVVTDPPTESATVTFEGRLFLNGDEVSSWTSSDDVTFIVPGIPVRNGLPPDWTFPHVPYCDSSDGVSFTSCKASRELAATANSRFVVVVESSEDSGENNVSVSLIESEQSESDEEVEWTEVSTTELDCDTTVVVVVSDDSHAHYVAHQIPRACSWIRSVIDQPISNIENQAQY